MIHIDSITIKEFRGIRDLTLVFDQKNFAICGPNGTGKSGVVDALEFVLTGNISRLSGEGRGEVSLKQHAPHVDKRDDPAKAVVSIKVTIPSLGKTVTIERNAKTPLLSKVTPSDPDVLSILRKIEVHPEIVLSRRELIRYVLATPGDRAKEVQVLLHLNQIEQLRVSLQKIANSAEKQLSPLDMEVKTSGESLLRALSVPELTAKDILSSVNIQRKILGLPDLVELTSTTSLKDGMAAPVPARPQAISKAQAIADLQAAQITLNDLESEKTKSEGTTLIAELAPVMADATIMADISKQGFYTTGLALIENDACPFCGNAWDIGELKTHAKAKIERLKEASNKRTEIEKKIEPLILKLRKAQAGIETLVRHAALTKPQVGMKSAHDYVQICKKYIQALNDFLPLSETESVLKCFSKVPQTVRDDISNLEKVISDLPEPNKQDAAREFLTLAQERLGMFREAKRKQKTAKEHALRARKISDIYAHASDGVLTSLYTEVQEKFAALYAFINRNDEESFSAKLIPSVGKLGFEVDFYGRGFFPPGAYHSEGHQDGMGLCLYLALMRHLQGENFTFAVLDDVLMSVDTGHRREVCALLKKEFPNTQFIMTTHDPIWLRHMKTTQLISGRGAVQFRTWNVENGPTEWDDRDVWTEIDDHLNKNDVRAAAALLRHYLEYTAAELCHLLRAPVAFRSDAHYQLGELLPAAISRIKKLYGSAKKAANSWNQKETVASLSAQDVAFDGLVSASKVEEWQVNTSIHFNSWDNLTKQDFLPVAAAFRELLKGFACPDCGGFLYVSPEREAQEMLRCECNKISINLVEKA